MNATSSVPGRRQAVLRVVVASAVLLFAQLTLIRWSGSEIPRLAFFKNLVLIGAFLGCGLGMSLGSRWPRLGRAAPALLGAFAVALPLMGPAEWVRGLRFGGASEFHWELEEAGTYLHSVLFVAFFVAMFGASVLLFVSLGAIVGEAIEDPALSSALSAYTWNLTGSLAGILAFGAASLLETGPPVWLLVLALPLGWCLAPARPIRALLLAGAVAGAALVAFVLSDDVTWSIYSRVRFREAALNVTPPVRVGQLDVDRAYFLRLLDLRPRAAEPGLFGQARFHYDLPYRFSACRRVLVLGAGGGNDVAAALRAGAEHVDAVEIDPTIVRYGRAHHPEGPYRSPRVNVVVDDARSFLRRTHGSYDVITLGLLDSHTLLAGLPGVRLDNFVYTVESLREARRHLSPQGILSLSFAVPADRPWLAVKLYRLVEEAFGEAPFVVDVGYDFSLLFLAGPGLASPRAQAARAALADRVVSPEEMTARAGPEPVSVPRDDWPHLYLRGRGVPGGQLLLLVVLLALSFAAARATLDLSGPPQLHFALLGAGFLLVETKGVADLGLLFGGTWWTVTAAFSGVLLMSLLSALLAARLSLRSVSWAYAGLAASLVASYLVRPGTLLPLPLGTARVIGALLVGLPVLFSGIVFATSFSRVVHPARALGWNLIGTVAGGFLEYLSLAWGVRSLSLVALAVYALSAVALRAAAADRAAPAP